jgi:hypothetical protein
MAGRLLIIAHNPRPSGSKRLQTCPLPTTIHTELRTFESFSNKGSRRQTTRNRPSRGRACARSSPVFATRCRSRARPSTPAAARPPPFPAARNRSGCGKTAIYSRLQPSIAVCGRPILQLGELTAHLSRRVCTAVYSQPRLQPSMAVCHIVGVYSCPLRPSTNVRVALSLVWLRRRLQHWQSVAEAGELQPFTAAEACCRAVAVYSS